MKEMVTGYLHPMYAASFEEYGTPRKLAHCGGWIIERPIPDQPYRDAMGCYPLFACREWSQLEMDLEKLRNEIITLSLVTDPFADIQPGYLQKCFDVVLPFKEHFVADLSLPLNKIVSRQHRYHARKALRDLEVEICPQPGQHLQEWLTLYNYLIARHEIRGIRVFSHESFAKQLNTPGMIMFRARNQGTPVGAVLTYLQGDVAYYHLSALSRQGYELHAAYAIQWKLLEFLVDKVKWLNLGAGSGIYQNQSDGLSQFKKGWATETRTAYFCGRVFDKAAYDTLVHDCDTTTSSYFPAYRAGEFS